MASLPIGEISVRDRFLKLVEFNSGLAVRFARVPGG